MRSLIHYVAGAVVCLGIGSAVLLLRIPVRKSARGEFTAIDQVFAVIILGIGVGYGVLAVREFAARRAERRPRRRRKRGP